MRQSPGSTQRADVGRGRVAMARWPLLLPLALAGWAPPASIAALSTRSGDPAAAAPAAVESTGTLFGAPWRGGAWGETASGIACWLRGPGGQLRIEVARDASATWRELDRAGWQLLLERRGEGWTFAAVSAGTATFQRWGDRLRTPPESLRRQAQLLSLLREGARGETPAHLPPWARPLSAGRRAVARVGLGPAGTRGGAPASSQPGSTGELRLVLAPPQPPGLSRSAFRAAQEERGRGHGPNTEVWTVTWRDDPDAGSVLRVVSSRREGFVEIAPPERRRVRYSPDDAFVPLWSLSELLTPAGDAPGDAAAR